MVALPTKPLRPGLGVRIAVSLDGSHLEVLDYAKIGRSDEWREAVLCNTAVRTLSFKMLKPGSHEMKVYELDPGVVLDRIVVATHFVNRSRPWIPERPSRTVPTSMLGSAG